MARKPYHLEDDPAGELSPRLVDAAGIPVVEDDSAARSAFRREFINGNPEGSDGSE